MTMTRSQTKPNRQILTEASEWFVTFRFDDADSSARERFSEWLRRSPEHIRAYLEITAVWAELPRHDFSSRIDLPALIARARAPDADIVALKYPPPVREQKKPYLSRRALLAASVLLFCALPLGAWLELNHAHTYATEIGEQRSITLSEGSTVDLNARSEIKVHFSKEERDVELVSGQALFKVAHNKERPFKVWVGKETVTAVGTEFDVYRKKTSTVVTVLEGQVALASDSQVAGTATAPNAPAAAASPRPLPQAYPVYLAAGEQAVVTAQSTVKRKRTDVQAATAWIQKKLVFDSTPLAEVVDEFNRYNTRALVVEGAELGGLAISGVYSSTDPTSLLRFLADVPGIVIVESAQEIRITRKSR
jgi:transmembrane sensor